MIYATTPDEIIDGRALWDGFPDAVFCLDRTGRIQRENAAARRLTGLRLGRFLQETLPEVFAREFQCASDTGEVKFFEFFWTAQETWTEAQIVPEQYGASVILRDITQRRQSEAAFGDNTARLDTLYEHSFDAIGVAVRGIHVFVNRAYLALFGYERLDEVLERPVLDLIAPSERSTIQHRVERRHSGLEEAVQYETRGLRRDGTEFDVEFRVSPYLRNGELHTLVILRDVTARKAAEKELRDSGMRFRALTERSGVGIWHVTLERETLYCNPAMCALLEADTPGDVQRRDYHDFFPAESQRIMEREHRKRSHGEVSSYEVDLVGLRGGRRRVLISGAPIFGPDKQLESILGTFTDLTARQASEAARRQAEEKYRSIFENAREGLFRTSAEGSILSANPALARMQGYASPQEMIADICDVGRQVYVDPSRRAKFLRLMQEQGQVTEFESQIYRRDGRIIWISESTRAIFDKDGDSDGTVLYYEGSSIEITARKMLEMERESLLQEAVERAERCAVTGLLNHRAFHRRLREEAEIARDTSGRLAVVALDMDNFKFFNDTYGHLAGDDVLRRVADALRAHCRASDSLARIGGDEFALLMPGLTQEDAEAVARRLTQSLARDGFCPPGMDRAVPLGLSAGVAVFPETGPDGVDALHQADVRLLAAKRGAAMSAEERSSGDAMLDGLLEAVDAKDRHTRCHSGDVQRHSLLLAQRLGMDEAAQETLTVAALLHDIGKIGISDRILRKPGVLTDDEWKIVRQHPSVGAALVGAAPGFAHLPEIAAAIRHHHEHWDGFGYPDGLQGETIPLPARILAVAEAYAAMTTDRPYAVALTEAEAQDALRAGAGTQWDPRCVTAFLGNMPPAPNNGAV